MSKASPDWTRRSRPGAVCSLRASPRSSSRPAESAWYSWTVPPGRGRSPNGVPRPRLSVYHTCTGTRLSSPDVWPTRSEEHTSELQSRLHLVCRLLLEKKKIKKFVTLDVDHG